MLFFNENRFAKKKNYYFEIFLNKQYEIDFFSYY